MSLIESAVSTRGMRRIWWCPTLWVRLLIGYSRTQHPELYSLIQHSWSSLRLAKMAEAELVPLGIPDVGAIEDIGDTLTWFAITGGTQ